VKTLAEDIVDVILADLTDRRGLRQEWSNIDRGVQDEIRATWAALIQKALDD
jgi:hypothetical protein